jgi:hypothetical protein
VINDDDVNTLRVIYLAMGAGGTMFALTSYLVPFFIQQAPANSSDQLIQTVHILSLILIAFCGTMYPLAGSIFRKTLLNQRQNQSPSQRVRSAYVIRIAIYEAVAFFGLTVLLAAGLFGLTEVQPLYFLTGLPYLILVGFITRTFPSKEALENQVR